MPNPYYIGSKGSILKAADLGLRFQQMKQHGRLTERELALRERRTTQEFGPEGTTGGGSVGRRTNVLERQAGVGERRNELATEELRIETPAHLKSFGEDKSAQARMMVGSLDMKLGEQPGKGAVSKSFQSVFNFIDGLSKSENIQTREQAYDLTKNAWPGLRARVIKDLTQEALSVMEKDPEKSQAIQQLISELGQDEEGQIVDQVFSQTVRSLAQQRAESELKFSETEKGVTTLIEGRENVARISAAGKETKGEKTKKSIKASYEKAIGRANSARMGVNIMSEAMGTEKDEIAKQEYNKAFRLAIEFDRRGGDIKELGVSPEDIREAFNAKVISEKVAKRLLMENF